MFLNGIFVSLKEGKMTLVATDGRRLALVDEEVEISEKSAGEFIVPAKPSTNSTGCCKTKATWNSGLVKTRPPSR